MSKAVVGLMDNRAEAEMVVRELIESGFDRDLLGIMANDEQRQTDGPRRTYGDDAEADTGAGALTGMGAGAAIGGIGGLAIGVAGLAIPGIGPIIAAGPLAAALAGAGVGAVAGGAVGALTNLGVPEDEAGHYAEGVRRGGVLVTVEADDEEDAERAVDVMRAHGAVDIDERAAEWRTTGWTRFDETAEPFERNVGVEEGAKSTRVVGQGHARVYGRLRDDPVGAARSGTRGSYTGPERRRNTGFQYSGVDRRAL